MEALLPLSCCAVSHSTLTAVRRACPPPWQSLGPTGAGPGGSRAAILPDNLGTACMFSEKELYAYETRSGASPFSPCLKSKIDHNCQFIGGSPLMWAGEM